MKQFIVFQGCLTEDVQKTAIPTPYGKNEKGVVPRWTSQRKVWAHKQLKIALRTYHHLFCMATNLMFIFLLTTIVHEPLKRFMEHQQEQGKLAIRMVKIPGRSLPFNFFIFLAKKIFVPTQDESTRI
jgi:hypothetical protein